MAEDMDRFKKAVKLILLMQATLEQMDELKTTAVYQRDIKQSMNNLERRIERFIKPHIKQLGESEEFMMMQISRGIDTIVNSSLEEIHNYTANEKEIRESSTD
jgi:DNA integrity scanning protein DisA with diadenylate cyclase activity